MHGQLLGGGATAGGSGLAPGSLGSCWLGLPPPGAAAGGDSIGSHDCARTLPPTPATRPAASRATLALFLIPVPFIEPVLAGVPFPGKQRRLTVV